MSQTRDPTRAHGDRRGRPRERAQRARDRPLVEPSRSAPRDPRADSGRHAGGRRSRRSTATRRFELATLRVDDHGPHLETTRNVDVHCGVGRIERLARRRSRSGARAGTSCRTRNCGACPSISTLPMRRRRRRARGDHAARAARVRRRSRALDRAAGRARRRRRASTRPHRRCRKCACCFRALPTRSAASPTGAGRRRSPSALRALGVLAPSGGSVPDAIDHLLHDPVAHLQRRHRERDGRSPGARRGDPRTRSAAIANAAGRSCRSPPARRRSRSTSRRGDDLGHCGRDAGRVRPRELVGALHDRRRGHTLDGDVTIGEAGATVAGGVDLRSSIAGARSRCDVRTGPGWRLPTKLPLWPTPDAAAIARALARILPAELLRIGARVAARARRDCARRSSTPSLAAVGLLGPADAGRTRRVLLPVALLADPAAWFCAQRRARRTERLRAREAHRVLDALKPLIGVAGGSR